MSSPRPPVDRANGPDPDDEAGVSGHPIRDGLTVLVGAVAAILVLIGHRSTPFTALGSAAVVMVSTWLAVIDFREHRLPNRIVGPLAGAVAVWLFVAGLVEDDLGRTARALGFGLAVAGFLLLANILGGLGMGDVKYGFPMAATVGWFGWDALSVTIVVTTVSGAVAAVVMLVLGRGRSAQLSYGPYMALGLAGGLLATAS